MQTQRLTEDEQFKPFNIVCVFSPPMQLLKNENGNQNDKNIADVKQLQDDLIQEKEDNKVEPEAKKAALINIIVDYNQQYGTNFSINEFDREWDLFLECFGVK
jgi:type I restriction enzyme, R subunit